MKKRIRAPLTIVLYGENIVDGTIIFDIRTISATCPRQYLNA